MDNTSATIHNTNNPLQSSPNSFSPGAISNSVIILATGNMTINLSSLNSNTSTMSNSSLFFVISAAYNNQSVPIIFSPTSEAGKNVLLVLPNPEMSLNKTINETVIAKPSPLNAISAAFKNVIYTNLYKIYQYNQITLDYKYISKSTIN